MTTLLYIPTILGVSIEFKNWKVIRVEQHKT